MPHPLPLLFLIFARETLPSHFSSAVSDWKHLKKQVQALGLSVENSMEEVDFVKFFQSAQAVRRDAVQSLAMGWGEGLIFGRTLGWILADTLDDPRISDGNLLTVRLNVKKWVDHFDEWHHVPRICDQIQKAMLQGKNAEKVLEREFFSVSVKEQFKSYSQQYYISFEQKILRAVVNPELPSGPPSGALRL